MPTGEWTIPSLTIDVLRRIVTDAAALCPHITAVGVVGSFARNTQRHSSDVDLLLQTDYDRNFQAALETFGDYVRYVLDYQFNKRLDIIRYSLARKRASREPGQDEIWFYRLGYAEMLNEVIWLYERQDSHFEDTKLCQEGQTHI